MRSIATGTSRLIAGREEPLIIGHRGASREAPGNSLASFSEAIRQGADGVELDVRRTLDGTLVIHHSATRHRVPVSKLTYADLVRRCRHEPPTLDAVARLCAGRIAVNIEIKERGFEAEVLELLSRRIGTEWLLITSFKAEVISTVKQLDPTLTCGLVVGLAGMLGKSRRNPRPPLQRAVECGADFIVPHQLLAPPPRAPRRHHGILEPADQRGMPVVVWTVNGPARMRRYLADARVAGIITDLPGEAVKIRRRLRDTWLRSAG
jgi:glycerophosphoryl diester phosphodiesterase